MLEEIKEALEKELPHLSWSVERAMSHEFGEYISVYACDANGMIVYAECYFKADGYPPLSVVIKNAKYQTQGWCRA